MGFFDEENTRLETVWFCVLAMICLLCFPFGVRLARRFPQLYATKLVPMLCLLLAYENFVLALSNALSSESFLVQIAKTTRAAVIPLFLVVMFEVAYAVHKRRSVKFCGIVFDQGHRRSVEPCSWFLRNFVRIVAVMIFVVGIVVNYDSIDGNDEKAGSTGLVDVEDASVHLLLALLPTTGMALIALYIAAYMWKYGNDASIVVQTTICNGWMFLFLGTLALLGGQVPPEWCFRVVNESGQTLLLLSMIAIGREIGKEVQAADNFSSFLEKENELESGSASISLSAITPALDRSQAPPPEGETSGVPEGAATVASGGKEEEADEAGWAGADQQQQQQQHQQQDEEEGRTNGGRSGTSDARDWSEHEMIAMGASAASREQDACAERADGLENIDDVTRPMERRSGPLGYVRQRSGGFEKMSASWLEDGQEGFSGPVEGEHERAIHDDTEADDTEADVTENLPRRFSNDTR